MAKHTFAALLLIETDDPRLTVDAAMQAMRTPAGVARLRAAVIEHLPRDIQRLVAVMSVDEAQQLMRLHEAFGENLGVGGFQRPPPDYIPPTRD